MAPLLFENTAVAVHLPEARQCNEDECEFFRRFTVW